MPLRTNLGSDDKPWLAPDDNKEALRDAAGCSRPGYLWHEAAVWHDATERWLFMPRRASAEAWEEEPSVDYEGFAEADDFFAMEARSFRCSFLFDAPSHLHAAPPSTIYAHPGPRPHSAQDDVGADPLNLPSAFDDEDEAARAYATACRGAGRNVEPSSAHRGIYWNKNILKFNCKFYCIASFFRFHFYIFNILGRR